jgi:hypothetical protein
LFQIGFRFQTPTNAFLNNAPPDQSAIQDRNEIYWNYTVGHHLREAQNAPADGRRL